MKISILKECRLHEARVALSPGMVKKIVALGHDIFIETGAGDKASFTDKAYEEAGAHVLDDPLKVCKEAHILLKVQRPTGPFENLRDEISFLNKEMILIGLLAPYNHPEMLDIYQKQGVTAMALELMPRISRAQAMDVLSSQSNLAGYRAVIEASYIFNRAFPMMMTAAGTVAPARVLILGAGVAGLQAIATAKRLGAIVSAFDVREAAREQVESLGATFVSVEGAKDAEDAKGYASVTDETYRQRQADRIAEALKISDIVISTALIPGKAAPRLVTADMIANMKQGSVLVDLAVEQGGNIEGSVAGDVIKHQGVTLIGYANMPSRIAFDASQLYARNIFNFLELILTSDGRVVLNQEDPIIQGVTLTHQGKIVHPHFNSGE